MSNVTDSFVMDRFIDEAMVIISDKLLLSKRKKRTFRRSLKSTLSDDVDINIIPSLGRSIMVSLFDDGVDDTDVDSIIESTKNICKQFIVENIHTILIAIAEESDGHDPESRHSSEVSVHDIYKTIESRVGKISFDGDEPEEELIYICSVFSEIGGFDMASFEEIVSIDLANALNGDIEAEWETESDSEWESDEDDDIPLIGSDDGDIHTFGGDNLFGRYEDHKIQNVMVEVEKYNDKLQKLREEFEELKGEIVVQTCSSLLLTGWAFLISYQLGYFSTNPDTDSPRALEMHPF
jgi:hypothetical protein